MKKFSDDSEVVKLVWVIESVANVMMKNSLMMNWHKKKFDSKFLLLIQTSTDTNLCLCNRSPELENCKQLSLSLWPSLTVSLHLFLCNWRISSKQADLSLSLHLFPQNWRNFSKQAALSLTLSLSSTISFPKIGGFPASKQVSLPLSLSLSLSLAPVFLSIIGEFSASKKQHKMN
jgi:hypothetical protein